MKALKITLLFSFFIYLAGCSSVTYKSDFDPEYNFGEFKTYRWASAKELNPDDVLARNPLLQKRVMEAVDNTLAKKGFVKADDNSENVDVVVVAHAGMKEKMQVNQTGGYYGGYRGWYDPWWGAYGGTTTVSYYEEATLVIDMVAWSSKELAWRGMATGTVKENQTGEEQQERLNEVVAKIFEQYPPGSGKK